MAYKIRPWIAGALLCMALGKANAERFNFDDREQQRSAQHQEQLLQKLTPPLAQPDVRLPDSIEDFLAPQEAPCFRIEHLVFEEAAGFSWLEKKARQALGQCLGGQGLHALQDWLNRALLARGYVVSRVVVPEQSIQDGQLRLILMPGRISRIREEGQGAGWLALMLPFKVGDVVRQQDLDQAIEQLRRLPGHQAEMSLVPGEQPGDTEIVIKHTPGQRWHALFSLDNSGSQSTGKQQAALSASLDSPFHLYDVLNLSLSRDAHWHRLDYGSDSAALNWSVPLGYSVLSMSVNRSRYHQTVAGYSSDLVYAGRSFGYDIGLSRVVYRDSNNRIALDGKLWRRTSHSEIDEVEIDVQARDMVGYEAGLGVRHYLGTSVLDGRVGLKGSLPTHSKEPGEMAGEPEWDGRYQLVSADFSFTAPFQVGALPMRYDTSLRGQLSRTALLPSYEWLSIGNRYSVRGFDGEVTLAGEDGAYWQNTLSVPYPPIPGAEVYLGLDYGYVGGRQADDFLLGNDLAGWVVGMRGSAKAFRYEFSLGGPVAKPEGFGSSHLTGTFWMGVSL
ncbi:ShlB/FhaC/HecB family hemolysin secretion/activation protein [Chitiniphilus eburneus]|uniref:ShlB/FhaC/HecB family hemolysin secretion/activation protein n=1 Tax=Chitiniphilus eburneus TaxID=2571148 RepID=A0A4V5MP97_9NEIS|nr:ShlB/FhaC/HecB family hemolysin secretion/activation protein [Chitiniphilus eburneus]TJZ64608.1 ShlB/FhaC/HecB family hemolysin secretion/activation protein [Chitiniphilus eburneus]